MARWQTGTHERLVAAAVELYAERGFDDTTVAQIAERAGVTKSTFFRHFPDKRGILAAGQEALGRLLSEGVAAAPAGASPVEAVAEGLRRASDAMGPANRRLGPQLKQAIEANAELRERDAVKSASLAAAMTDALVERGVAEPLAALAGELGVIAFRRGYDAWVSDSAEPDADLARYTLAALDELHTATRRLG